MMKKTGDIIFGRGEYTCPWWICFAFDNPLRTLIQNPEKIAVRCLKAGDKVLDIGPGMGYLTFPFANRVTDTGMVYALDIQKAMLDRLQARIEKKKAGNIIARYYDGTNFGIHEKFDFIAMFWMYHEVRNKENFIAELKKVSKPGTKVLISEPIIHVTKTAFAESLKALEGFGFIKDEEIKISMSYSAILKHVI